MTARNLLTLIGSILLALGPALKSNGGTELEWRLGEYAGIIGGLLVGARAVMAEPKRR